MIIFITPPGKSEELSTSANVTAQSGLEKEGSTIQVSPPAITGAITETIPIREEFCGAIRDTTPVGSGVEKLKCEEATGFTELNIC